MIEFTSSRVFSDDAIRRFLLGELTVGEQEAFEKRLVADDELEARVRLSELGLADDYVQRRLTRAESLRVQERFLVTKDRQHMTAVSQALRDRFTPATRWSAQKVFNLDHAAWRYAFAAVILIIVFATVWLGVKERRLAIKFPIPKRVLPKASPTQSPVVAHHPVGALAPTHQEEATPPPEHQTTVSIALDAKNTVENPFELKLSDTAITSLRIVATPERNQRDSYRAEVWNSRGESVFTADGLTPSDEGKLTLDIPALVLSPGEYMIRLNGREDAAELHYYFRIIR
ncbi:MAG TPA: hypothetical protein VNG71_14690 [Pyrinomonadaceae bacterium]|nr:hypothetical protein [Pyrinomonadaceae bacterium]